MTKRRKKRKKQPRRKKRIRRRAKKTIRRKTVRRRKKMKKIKSVGIRVGQAFERRGASRYIIDNSFQFLYELRDLILKASPAEKNNLIERISKLGRIKLAIIAGIFMTRESINPAVADLLIVGDDIDARRLRVFLRTLESEVGKEIKFAVMEKDEFQYRMSMFDRFIKVLLESPHEKIINKLGL